jgi:hypothetical protein
MSFALQPPCSRERVPVSHRIGVWVDPTSGLDNMELCVFACKCVVCSCQKYEMSPE